LIYKGRLIAQDTPAGIKKMIPGHLIEFKPARFEAARKLMTGMPGILEVQTYGAMLHLFVDEVESRQKQIEAVLEGQGIAWSGMRVIQPRMEEAFISLVRRQEASENGQ
jgi:ABC-type multidrug transport system ATPase subunit